MGLRGDIQRRIEKKMQEISGLETQLRETRSYLQALEDTLKIVPREDLNGGHGDGVLKPGSAIAKARDAIRKAGRPLHIKDVLAAIGRPQDNANRAAISGSIAAYVRRGEIFTRPAPNTFGLIEMNGSGGSGADSELPEGFGKD